MMISRRQKNNRIGKRFCGCAFVSLIAPTYVLLTRNVFFLSRRKRQIALTKPLKPGQRVYVKLRTETDEAALAGIDPTMDTTHYVDDEEDAMMDTKEEFVVCAFIGNAVESTSVDLVLRDYCEFAIETNGGGSDDDDDSEVEAHLTGYYVPEYDEDEDAAANAYGDEGEEMYDEEDEDDEDFMGFDDEDEDDEDFSSSSSSEEDEEDESDEEEDEEEIFDEGKDQTGRKKVTQKGGVVIKELSDDEEESESESDEAEDEEEEEEEEEEHPPASKKQKTAANKNNKQNTTPISKDNVNTQKPTKEHRNGMEIVNTHQTTKPNSKKATPGSRCQMKYVGKLPSGKIFDQTKGNAGFTFRLGVGEVIKGWDVGVNGMREGDKRTLYVPASMGYGKKGVPGTIPKNSPLVFDVELMRVLK